MDDTFKALVINKDEDKITANFNTLTQDDLMDGDVEVDIHYSTLNYKDGLSITGKRQIARVMPLIAGIDFSGIVTKSTNPDFQPGDKVVLNGYGIGETHHGGYAQKARVKAEWLIKLPDDMDLETAMGIGTAGYTAMLSLMALQNHGVTPQDGPILVSGAKGGVGSTAIALLAHNDFEVIALTRDLQHVDYLKNLGASEVMTSEQFSQKPPMLGKTLYAGGIDCVGSSILANMLTQTKYNGAVTSCGLAMGAEIPITVAPFIFRNVALLGIDSVQTPKHKRVTAWQRLNSELSLEKLSSMTFLANFDELPKLAEDIMAGTLRGRAIIKIKS